MSLLKSLPSKVACLQQNVDIKWPWANLPNFALLNGWMLIVMMENPSPRLMLNNDQPDLDWHGMMPCTAKKKSPHSCKTSRYIFRHPSRRKWGNRRRGVDPKNSWLEWWNHESFLTLKLQSWYFEFFISWLDTSLKKMLLFTSQAHVLFFYTWGQIFQ